MASFPRAMLAAALLVTLGCAHAPVTGPSSPCADPCTPRACPAAYRCEPTSDCRASCVPERLPEGRL